MRPINLHFALLILVISSATANAQIKIGANPTTLQAGQLLQLETNGNRGGLKIAEVALTSATDQTTINISSSAVGTLIWNTATAGTAPDNVTPGFYCWDGSRWIRLANTSASNPNQGKLFYMPAIAVDVSTASTGQTLNLYQLYKDQFSPSAWNTANQNAKNPSAPNEIPYFPSATDLHYYVTKYDTNAMTITSISDSGIMTYNVSGNGASPCSLLNIVFVHK